MALLAVGSKTRAATNAGFADDFDLLWRTIDEGYCFFDEKETDWAKVRSIYAPLAAMAVGVESFAEVVRLALNELYDAHTHLSSPADGTPRWPPFDLYVVLDRAGALIVDVRAGSAAETAGLVPNRVINAVDGVDITEAAAAQMPVCLGRPDPLAASYALNVAVAGRRGAPRLIGLSNGAALDLALQTGPQEPDVSFDAIEELGYIRIASFGDPSSVDVFDAALKRLQYSRGLIIDVRRNGGGDTAVARPIMGRFIGERAPYARMRRREGRGFGRAWTEYVEPRGPFTYEAPVVVLVDRWSASMAEGFPMGMRGLGRARIVGTKMMGLGAAVLTIQLPVSGIALQYSAEPVYDSANKPRWELSPDIEVSPGVDILQTGLSELRRLIAG